VIQTKTEECVRDGLTYRVETTWDDESGNAEIREFTVDGQLVRSCDWRIWPEDERRQDQIRPAWRLGNQTASEESRSFPSEWRPSSAVAW
jgi:hypothetical protein